MTYGYGRGAGMMGGGYSPILDLIWVLLVLLVVAGIIFAIVLVIRSANRPHDMGGSPPVGPTTQAPVPPKDEACDIARRRYAAGEITKDEYQEICGTLGV
jgi:uncharacterized membrane protein